jgi:effector-binding domain-containing protein
VLGEIAFAQHNVVHGFGFDDPPEKENVLPESQTPQLVSHNEKQFRFLPVSPKHRMSYRIELTHPDTTYTAVVRSRVPQKDLSRFVPAACGEVWSFIRSAGLPKPGRHIAVYLDRQGSIEVGAEVSEPFADNDRIRCSRLPSGRAATTVHYGPYARLSEAHAAIRHWCTEHGHPLSDTSWEVYGHWDESWNTEPLQIRTDVFHLLQEQEG